MRMTTLAILISLACALGCEKKKETPPPAAEGGGIEINAPGVDVKVAPGEGVEVKAPGADVEAKPGDVKVDTEAPN